MAHVCASKLTIVDSDNGLLPGRHQAIIWASARILLIGSPGTNSNEILIEIHRYSFKKMHLKMSSGECWPSCLGPNVLRAHMWFWVDYVETTFRSYDCGMWLQGICIDIYYHLSIPVFILTCGITFKLTYVLCTSISNRRDPHSFLFDIDLT